MVLWLILLGYYVFGLLLMDCMCPCWPTFEKMIGAAIWPISLVIVIRWMVQDRKRDERHEAFRTEMEMLLILLPIVAVLNKLPTVIAANKVKPEDTWTPDRN